MTVSLKLDDILGDRLRQIAEARRLSPDSIAQEAIREYIQRADLRSSFVEDAQAAWSDFQQSGRHLTDAELSVWLQRWGTDAETEIPVCHG